MLLVRMAIINQFSAPCKGHGVSIYEHTANQLEEAGSKKAKPPMVTPSAGIHLWAVCKKGSAHDPPPENVATGRDAVGIPERRRARAYIYAPEPLLCLCSRAGHGSVREPLLGHSQQTL